MTSEDDRVNVTIYANGEITSLTRWRETDETAADVLRRIEAELAAMEGANA